MVAYFWDYLKLPYGILNINHKNELLRSLWPMGNLKVFFLEGFQHFLQRFLYGAYAGFVRDFGFGVFRAGGLHSG